jgi:hypothetical protein
VALEKLQANDTELYDKVAAVGSFKNRLINGGFDFWQRGTLFTGNGTRYSADRWIFQVAGMVNPVMNMSPFGPNDQNRPDGQVNAAAFLAEATNLFLRSALKTYCSSRAGR